MALLIIRIPGQPPLETVIDGPTVVGRSPEADLSLNHAGLSRKHCRIEPVDEFWRVVDLKSRSGTFVGDVQVTEGFLKDQDTIRLADIVIEFQSQADLEEEHDGSVGASFEPNNWSNDESQAPAVVAAPQRSDTAAAILDWESTKVSKSAAAVAEPSGRTKQIMLALAALALLAGGWLIYSELAGESNQPNPSVVNANWVQAKGD